MDLLSARRAFGAVIVTLCLVLVCVFYVYSGKPNEDNVASFPMTATLTLKSPDLTAAMNRKAQNSRRRLSKLKSQVLTKKSRASPLPKKFTPLSKDVVDGVEKFVFFVGYARSGHSFVGSLMDAHPNMIISHEFGLFTRLIEKPRKFMYKGILFNALYRDSYEDAVSGWRSEDYGKKGYDFALGSSSWQGRFKKLRVIGDKSGGRTTSEDLKRPKAVRAAYDRLSKTVEVPIHVIHVVRNPFDIAATSVLYHAEESKHGQKLAATAEHKYKNPELLFHAAKKYIAHGYSVQNMSHDCGFKMLDVHNVDLIRDPKGTMQQICDFLDLECPAEYLQECYNKTFKTLSITRNRVVWTKKARAVIEDGIKNIPFFQRYSYEGED